MPDVFLERVVGGEIQAAAEPEYVRVGRGRRIGDEAAYVHVHCGHIRGARVQYQRDAHRLRGPSGEMRASGAGGRRQLLATDVAEKHGRSFEYGPALQVATHAATTFSPRPGVAGEWSITDALQRLDDGVL